MYCQRLFPFLKTGLGIEVCLSLLTLGQVLGTLLSIY